MKVDADDGSGPEQAAPEHGTESPRESTRNRPSRAAHAKPAGRDVRPGTGADSGFSDADDPALPPEAAAAIREAQALQGAATRPRQGTPAATAPTPGAPGAPGAVGAPGTTRAPASRPSVPRRAARPANPVSDQSTNSRSNRLAGPAVVPVAYFNAVPGARGARLVLHTSAGTAPEHTVTLRCDPPGGTHPRAAQACADVNRAGGDLAQVPAKNTRACFMIYHPVTVTARGSWHGQPVSFTKKYPNTCVMHDKTGSVFDF